MVTYLEWFLHKKLSDPLVTWSHRSGDKLKPLYLPYHSAYSHQTWKVGDFSWGAPIHLVTWPLNHMVLLDYGLDIQWRASIHKVTWSFNHIVLWCHVINWIFYISTCTRPMATKHGKVLTYREGLPPTATMPMVTKLVRIQRNCKRLPPLKHNVTNVANSKNFYLQLCETYGE